MCECVVVVDPVVRRIRTINVKCMHVLCNGIKLRYIFCNILVIIEMTVHDAKSHRCYLYDAVLAALHNKGLSFL